MTDLSGYELEPLRGGSEYVLYRGRRPGDPVPILVVAPTAAQQAPANLAQLEHEYGLADQLDPAWATHPLELVRHEGRMVLILADPGGLPLDVKLLAGPLALPRLLRVAIAAAAALCEVHRRGLVHKDIKPGNLLVDDAGNVWLTGFRVASRLPRERQAPEPPEVIAGTFAYMAPEQTGRMNRSIDARSDLYSFGVTLYEMLTGALPFTASDPMEWIHCHIARQPVPPRDRLKGIPEPIEAIILKLLAKTAEDRYQTAAEVGADLRRCLSAWEAHGRIDAFLLGGHDASAQLLIPEKLYGREAEIGALVAAFDRVATRGATELVLVSGYAGIGKSSIVNELHKVLVPSGGLFAAGKFDQYKRNIPYVTLAQAFQSLIRQLLSRNDAELGRWRQALSEALGPNGGLMVNLIPELALIIGEQPPVPDLPPQDAQNRFYLVFRRFLGVFAQPEHPLAIFLDDLQWLDAATLELLERLVTEPDVRHLLLVGAYRDNEVSASDPLMRTLDVIRNAGGRVREIILAPLRPDDVGRFVADALQAERDRVRPLAELVFEKTDGNPFFAIQFVTALADEGLLAFDPNTSTWQWDMDRVRAKGITDNVVDLMTGKLSRLPDAPVEVLKQFACLGNYAQTATLAMVLDVSEAEVHATLWVVVRAGLVARLNDGYAFLHDRVQEAAYSLIPESERAAVHLAIGRLLASRTAPAELEEKIFEIVNQLDRGIALIHETEERERVAELNLTAGTRAKASTAHAAARDYLAQAVTLFSPDSWTSRYEKTFELYLAFSECEYLVGNFAAADELFDLILSKARSDLDRAKVYSLRIKLYQVAGKYDDGLAVALDALRLFGLTLPKSDQEIQAAVDSEFRDVPTNLAGRPIGDLLELPSAADPAMRTIINLLVDATPCAYIARPALFPLIALKAVNLSMRHGNTDQSSFAYAIYAIMLVSIVGDIASAFQFSEMSLRLNEKFNNARLRGTLLHLHGDHINFWRHHIATDLPILDKAFRACLEVGDLVYAGFLAFETVWQVIEKGDALDDVLAQSAKYAAFARQSHNDAVYETIQLEQQFVASLQGRTTDPLSFDADAFNEAASFAVIVKAAFGCGIVFYHIMKQMLAYLYGRHAEALDSAVRAEPVLGAAMGMPIEATYHFYHALTLTALYPTAPTALQEDYRRTLTEKLKKLELWAANCPENYRNRYALVAAEIARIEGRDTDAMRLYEESVRSARENGFIQNEGLANELAARFYAARGFKTIADTYVRNARSCYLRWGADGKVRQLEQLHPQLRPDPAPVPTATIGTPVEQLDLATVVKVSQAISSEIDLEKLINTLMLIALEHAGARRGLLILSDGGELRIEAEATTVRDAVEVRLRQAPVTAAELPESILRYVARTQDSVLLDDALEQNPFSNDAYIRQNHSRSVLCLPLTKQAMLIGVLYLENNETSRVFTPARISVLRLLASQAAISLENARLYAGLITENHDRRRAEEALRKSEASLAEGQRISHTGNWRWNVRTGAAWGSDETFRIFGIDPSLKQFSYDIYMETVHPEDRPFVDQALASAVIETTSFQYEYRVMTADGSIKHLQSTGYPEIGESGELEFVGTVMDITERRHAEAALRRAQVELGRASRLSTMGELAGSIVHEVNQPLAAIITNADACLLWLNRDEPDLTEARASIARLAQDGRRAADVIKGLRALARKSGLDLVDVDINDTIREVLALLRGELERGQVVLHLDLLAGIRPVTGDRVQLQQVLVNLIRNGIEAMSGVADRPRVLTISSASAESGDALVAIEDSGAGLDSTTAGRMFDPLFTTKPHGMGMGLAICRSIVEAHRGRLWASPSLPRGTVMRFTLPFAEDRP